MEVTYRTLHGRFLLRPSEELNRRIVGVLAQAQSLADEVASDRDPPSEGPAVGLVGIVVLSNHLHLLLSVADQQCLSKLMEFFGGNSAREVNELQGWSGKFWDDRYSSICVTTEERAQVARLEYLLSQAVKEGLVAKVSDWPGLHFGKTLLEGRSLLPGHWIDRTKLYRARRRGKTLVREEYITEVTVELQQLPCWSHLSWGEYLRRIEEIIVRIEAEAALERERAGREVLGPRAVLAQDPHYRPARERPTEGRHRADKLEERQAPMVHAATKEAHRVWREAFAIFLAAYRDASERFRGGEGNVIFPEGCFPPALPFVGSVGDTPPPRAAPG